MGQISNIREGVTLDDKWTITSGRALMSGTQALARILLDQKALDEKNGLRTAGYISGYRGSPLGNVDNTLWGIGDRLKAADILFVPGVNEDLAATAVRGTQQIDAVPDALYEGVFAAWYGKGPGVDRSGDALKHGNYTGTHPKGGVAVLYGDDHGGKSSSVAHQSEQALAAALIPSLYPSNVTEILQYGLYAFALSRYSGAWVGIKLVNEVVEQTATVDFDLTAFNVVLPPYGALPPEGIHARSDAYGPLRDEQIVTDYRLPAMYDFLRANPLDREIFRGTMPRLGLVTAGKSYGDTRQAMEMLGLDEERAADLGISLYKIGCIWPLETEGFLRFAAGHETLFFVEEKKAFLEEQAAVALINQHSRPRIIGKRDEAGDPLLPLALQLEPARIAMAIADRLQQLGIRDPQIEAAAAGLAKRSLVSHPNIAVPRRKPFFCSGCPHSRSTKIPEGSLSMTGIGCHTMVNFVRPREALLPTHMGGEGGNWLGIAPFSGTKHIFQNMGDGTYYHSGLLAIRAAVAAGVNITYKILYNDAVAMTGGQPVDGPLSVSEIAHQVLHEGVRQVIIVSDDPGHHAADRTLPAGIRIEHRDSLDAVQRDMREIEGCTVLIYEQTCAAEKRRRRKRGQFPDPAKRLFISQDICEGCGDCSVQSTCVSLTPVETQFGTKRKIDQSSCNKDFSCQSGFCPSFITVLGAEPRKPVATAVPPRLLDNLAEPPPCHLADNGFGMIVTGIGGTGVITVAAVLGMAAHLDGRAVSVFDMTGLAQKNGAVLSHLRIAQRQDRLHAQKLGQGEADLLLAFDLVTAMSDDPRAAMSKGKTHALVNSDVVPTVEFQFDRDFKIDGQLLMTRLKGQLGSDHVDAVDATAIATALLGDSIGTNMFLVGVASQRGLLPVSAAAIEEAIRLNRTAVDLNIQAFRLGRLFVEDEAAIVSLLSPRPNAPVPVDLDALIEGRMSHLIDYQNRALAERYRALVDRVRLAEERLAPDRSELTEAVARNYSKLLSYKDEYEVARLLSSPKLRSELETNFASGGRFEFNLAPPILSRPGANGRPRKLSFSYRLMRPFLALLARLKPLRGTRFDLFGYRAERIEERRLIREYEELTARVLGGLTRLNHDRAVKLLQLVDMVRGFGPVKAEAMNAYASRVGQLEAEFVKERAEAA